MQLSILLSLIHARGESLPDKRTELYDKYIEIFLAREVEKNPTIKKHQRLLIDIHRYLGYYLHARAEQDQSTGRISYHELREVISSYLLAEGRSIDAVEELLIGIVQRVVALVSRVEGTYEFEVQPLREYFAARHLYDTAPYSPAGRQCSGTKPDRFDGIARNGYWLNVTRFFSGCFSKGELLDLAERLSELIDISEPGPLTYPRMLGVALLQDWVFFQSPKATKKAINAIFDDFGLRWAGIELRAHDATRSLGDISLIMSEDTGALELTDIAWSKIAGSMRGEAVTELCQYVKKLPVYSNIAARWSEEYPLRSDAAERGYWIRIGALLKVFEPQSMVDVSAILEEDCSDESVAEIVSGGATLVNLPDEYVSRAIRAILDRRVLNNEQTVFERTDALTALRSLAFTEIWASAFHVQEPRLIARTLAAFNDDEGAARPSASPLKDMLRRLGAGVVRRTELNPFDGWREITAALEESFGKSFTVTELSVVSGYTAMYGGAYIRADRLFDPAFSGSDRVRSARRRSGNVTWWLSQYDSAQDNYDLVLWALCAFAWATPDCFARVIPKFDAVVRCLDARDRLVLIDACQRASDYSKNASKTLPSSCIPGGVEAYDPSTMAIVSKRLERSPETDLAINHYLVDNLDAPGVANWILKFLATEATSGKLWPRNGLDLARSCYAAGATMRPGIVGFRKGGYDTRIAHEVLAECWAMPSVLVLGAIRSVGNGLPPVLPVGVIAESEKWFVADDDRAR